MKIKYSLNYMGRDTTSNTRSYSDSKELVELGQNFPEIASSFREVANAFSRTMQLINEKRPGETLEAKLVINGVSKTN